MNKKASLELSSETIVTVVIAAVVILVGVYVIITIMTRGQGTLEDAPCAQSVRQQALLKSDIRLFGSGLKCPTRLVEVGSPKVDVVKKTIADQLLKCWNTFGAGKLELFSDDEAVYCHACAHLIIPEGVKVSSEELLKTLEQPIGSSLPELVGKTYVQAIAPTVKDDEAYFDKAEVDAATSRGTSTIVDSDTNQDYAIVFRYAKGRDSIKNVLTKVDAASPGVGTALVGVGVIAIGVKVVGVGVMATVGAPVTAIALGAVVVGGVYAWVASSYAQEPQSWMADVHIRPYDRDTLTSLGCKVVET